MPTPLDPSDRTGCEFGRPGDQISTQFDGIGGTAATRLGIRELRGRLTSLVRRAGSGERILITIAGRAVAQLGPVEPSGATVTIDDLAAQGLLEPAHRSDRPVEPGMRVDNWTGGRLDRSLREVRGA